MAAYRIGHSYCASRDGRQFGPWSAGDVVELDPADAEWVGRDSPGVLTEAKTRSEREQLPAADRQHRGGRTRGQ